MACIHAVMQPSPLILQPPHGAFPEQSPPPTAPPTPASSACPLSVEKLELKNIVNQRSKKMQKEKKTVKQDKIIIVLKQSRTSSRAIDNILIHVFWAVLQILMGSEGKESTAMQETWIWTLTWENPLEKGMATHSSILAWRIPWTEEPGGPQSMGSQRVRHNWTTNTFTSVSVLGENQNVTNLFQRF